MVHWAWSCIFHIFLQIILWVFLFGFLHGFFLVAWLVGLLWVFFWFVFGCFGLGWVFLCLLGFFGLGGFFQAFFFAFEMGLRSITDSLHWISKFCLARWMQFGKQKFYSCFAHCLPAVIIVPNKYTAWAVTKHSTEMDPAPWCCA